jgi:hypothetical protein
VKKGLPALPMFSTVIATCVLNLVVGYHLAQAFAPGRVLVLPTTIVVASLVIGIVAAVVAVQSWRAHLRGRRMLS